MKRVIKLFAFSAVILAAASCGKSRTEQMALAENVRISCTPEVLALVGDKVDAEITVTFPERYFYPKTILEVTPVLVYEGGEAAGKTFTYQGEKVKDNYTVVSYDGGSVKENVSFDYADGMEKSCKLSAILRSLRTIARVEKVSFSKPSSTPMTRTIASTGARDNASRQRCRASPQRRRWPATESPSLPTSDKRRLAICGVQSIRVSSGSTFSCDF